MQIPGLGNGELLLVFCSCLPDIVTEDILGTQNIVVKNDLGYKELASKHFLGNKQLVN